MSSSSSSSSPLNAATLRTHASHIWKFLDDLAASDPKAYKDFIAKQRQNAEKERDRENNERNGNGNGNDNGNNESEEGKYFQPKPSFCLSTMAKMKCDPQHTHTHKRKRVVVLGNDGVEEEREREKKKDKQYVLFVNICQSHAVPGPQDRAGKPANDSVPLNRVVIPLSVGKIRDIKRKHDQIGMYLCAVILIRIVCDYTYTYAYLKFSSTYAFYLFLSL